MTPEQRIVLAKIKYNYLDDVPSNNEVYDYFGHYGQFWHSYYEKAKKIYWHYQNLYSLSPATDTQPTFKDLEECDLWLQFHKLMKRGYYRV